MSSTFLDMSASFSRINIVKHCLYNHFVNDKKLNPCQLQVIAYVKDHPGCAQIELSNLLMVTPASIALTTKRMEKSGLITKKTDNDNLRCNRLYVTQKGKEIYNYNMIIINKIDSIMFEGLSPNDINELTNILDLILANSIENSKKYLSKEKVEHIIRTTQRKIKEDGQ